MRKVKWVIVVSFLFFGFTMNFPVLSVAEAPILSTLSGAEKERVSKIIEDAKKEGALTYSTNSLQSFTEKKLHPKFKELYGLPKDFKITHYLLKSADLVARIDQEVKARKVTIDWFRVNVPTFWVELHRRGELLKYCSPEYKYYEKYSKAANFPSAPCYFSAQYPSCFTGIWNPKYIKENITSWYDFLNPKYKGKMIVANAAKAPVYLDTYIVLRKILDRSFFEKLAALNPFLLVRSTEIRDKVMTGEYPIAFWGYPPRAFQVLDQVELRSVYPKEGVVFLPTMTGILKQAKHPNAAKLWTDFMYGKTGMSINVESEACMTLREDLMPPPKVAKVIPPISKVKPIPFDWTTLTEKVRDKYRKEFIEIFSKRK